MVRRDAPIAALDDATTDAIDVEVLRVEDAFVEVRIVVGDVEELGQVDPNDPGTWVGLCNRVTARTGLGAVDVWRVTADACLYHAPDDGYTPGASTDFAQPAASVSSTAPVITPSPNGHA